MSEMPKITEITRWDYHPGDRLIATVATGSGTISAQQANEIAQRIRASLHLPDNAPIVIAGEGWSFAVISEID